MRDLNLKFLELYKSTDRFIKDAYQSTEGFTEYVRQMESEEREGKRRVSGWADDLKQIKHLRWIRNQLAHEVDYDSDICKQKDYELLTSFQYRLHNADDPLSLLQKSIEAQRLKNQDNNRVKDPTFVTQPIDDMPNQRNRRSLSMRGLRILIFGLGLMIAGIFGIMMFGMDNNPIVEVIRLLPFHNREVVGSVALIMTIAISVLNTIIGFALACCGAFQRENDSDGPSQDFE